MYAVAAPAAAGTSTETRRSAKLSSGRGRHRRASGRRSASLICPFRLEVSIGRGIGPSRHRLTAEQGIPPRDVASRAMPPRRRARSTGRAFTLELPRPLDARQDGDAWWIDVDGRELRLSNLNKVFWPEEGYTKGDLLAYYWNAADLIGPYLHGRPLTMKRMPDGIGGDHFYEKTAPSHTPGWIHRCKVLSDDAKRGEIDYLTVDDTATLLFVANLGCIEMHPLHSHCEDVEHPDYLFFDLDPFEPYTYEDVLTVARHIKVVLDQFGLTAYPKTSGATGLQISLPVKRGAYTYGQV